MLKVRLERLLRLVRSEVEGCGGPCFFITLKLVTDDRVYVLFYDAIWVDILKKTATADCLVFVAIAVNDVILRMDGDLKTVALSLPSSLVTRSSA